MVSEIDLSKKLDEISNRLSSLENYNSKKEKKEEADPFTYDYIKKRIFTKKYLFYVIVKSITKILVVSFLTLFFYDL
jgi:hypothetical protein